MTFDEQLKRAFETLSERLHDEVARQVAAAVADGGRSLEELRDRPSTARLLDGVVAIDRARSLHSVLDALVDHARKEADRTALLLVDGSGFRAWRFVGFESIPERPRSLRISKHEAGVIADAATMASVASGNAEAGPRFAALTPADDCIAVPLTLGNEAVAVLYADHGQRLGWSRAIEILTRHTSRCLETLVATKAARFAAGGGKGARTADTWSEEDEQASARRYARLLTSEIKLYHEAEVIAGRQSRDLAARLGGEIARARTLYEQRVPPHVRERADYFHAELVRTLADGDEALLPLER